MNEALMPYTNDPWTDPAALRKRSVAELWGMWLRVVWALLLRAAPPLTVWRQRAWERRMLAQMTERDLHDMRMTRHDAKVESNKPFWKA